MSDQAGEKKFDATAKRRETLRKKGNVAKSRDIPTTVVLAAGLIGILLLGGGITYSLAQFMAGCFQNAVHSVSTPFSIVNLQTIVPSSLGGYLITFFLLVGGASLSAHVAQTGLVISEEALTPKWEQLNPIQGVKRLFSLNRLFQSAQSLVKLIIIAAFAYLAINTLRESPVFFRPINILELGDTYLTVTWSIGWRILLALTCLATLDYLYQRWKFEKDNRMTFEEIKEERKSSESSPELLNRRRSIARRRSLRRMMEDMQDSTIVITNPTHYAVALRYKKGETEAPIVLAKGARRIAIKLKAHAYRLGIPVRENKPLAQGLYKHAQIGKEIPALYFQGVAVLLAQLYRQGFQRNNERQIEESSENK